MMVVAIIAPADDLGDLKAASLRYFVAMKGALALSDYLDSSETIAKANEYAAAKVAYYAAARKAMQALLQIAKGEQTDSTDGKELSRIFHGFGEDRDEEAMRTLEAKLNQCPTSDQRDQARFAIEHAKQAAEQFVKDFGRLEGV